MPHEHLVASDGAAAVKQSCRESARARGPFSEPGREEIPGVPVGADPERREVPGRRIRRRSPATACGAACRPRCPDVPRVRLQRRRRAALHPGVDRTPATIGCSVHSGVFRGAAPTGDGTTGATRPRDASVRSVAVAPRHPEESLGDPRPEPPPARPSGGRRPDVGRPGECLPRSADQGREGARSRMTNHGAPVPRCPGATHPGAPRDPWLVIERRMSDATVAERQQNAESPGRPCGRTLRRENVRGPHL